MICGESVARLKAKLATMQDPPDPVIDLAQLKGMLTTFYSVPWAILERSDNSDWLPDAKGIEYKVVDIPTTGHTLADKLTWTQLRAIMQGFQDKTRQVQGMQVQGWTDYVMRVWTGQSTNPEYPKVTGEIITKELKKVVKEVGAVL